MVSTSNPVNDPRDLETLFVKTGDGRYVPMSTIATIVESPIAPNLRREEQRRAVNVTASLDGGLALGRCLLPDGRDGPPDPARRHRHHSPGRGTHPRRSQQWPVHHLRLCPGHHPIGAGGAVRKPVERHHRHDHGAVRGRRRALCADVHRRQHEHLQPDRAGAGGGHHGQERHPDRRIRQSVARPRLARCARRSRKPPISACAR